MASDVPLGTASEECKTPQAPSLEPPVSPKMLPTQGLSVDYLISQLKSMEDRVKVLESEKKAVKPETKSEPKTKRKINLTPTVRWCDWEQFKNTFAEEEGHDSIDVLFSGQQLRDEVRHEFTRRIQVDDGTFDTAHTPLNLYSTGKEARWIQYIRIRSKIVLSTIAKIASVHGMYHLNVDMPAIFFEPFKSLISVHEDLKKEVQNISVNTENKYNNNNNPLEGHANVQNARLGSDAAPENMEGQNGGVAPITDDMHKHEAWSNKTVDANELAELNCYIKFMDEHIMTRFNQLRKGNAEGDFSKKVRIQDLWMLFEPGELVYFPEASSVSKRKQTTEQRIWRLYKFYDSEPNWRFDNIEREHYSSIGRKKKKKDADDADDAVDSGGEDDQDKLLSFYYLDYTGTTFCPVPFSCRIDEYEGEVDITALRAYPLRFHPNREETIAKLRSERQNFVEWAHSKNKRQMLYEGWSIVKDVAGNYVSGTDEDQKYIDSEVIIDFDEVFQSRPSWKPDFFWSVYLLNPTTEWKADPFPVIHWADKQRSKKLSEEKDLCQVCADFHVVEWNAYLQKDRYITLSTYTATNEPRKFDGITEDDVLLLPTRLFAYSLRERDYFQIDIRGLKRPERIQDPFGSLEIDYGHKRTIESLLHTHFENMDLNRGPGPAIPDQDLIRGKGRGIVILLHGAPGVGKTATAEAVAQKYDKPLFSIGCGDLGYHPDTVETALTEIFRLAQVWNCVLLLDEADVFLTQRSINDLKRNAMVSTILRILEYYKGVLFLTTNRPGSLDEALKSRVHVSLHYEPLSLEKVQKIFLINLDRLEIIEEARKKSTNSQGMYIFREEILEYAKEHFERYGNDRVGSWNGRQIRNSFQVASAMARYDGLKNPGSQVQLHASHFRDVAIATQKYDEFRKQTLNKTDQELARAYKHRDDSYVFSPERTVGVEQGGSYGQHDGVRRQLYPQSQNQPSDRSYGTPSYNMRNQPQAGFSSPIPPSAVPRSRTPLSTGSPSPYPSHSHSHSHGHGHGQMGQNPNQNQAGYIQNQSQGGYGAYSGQVPVSVQPNMVHNTPGMGQPATSDVTQQQPPWQGQPNVPNPNPSMMHNVDQAKREYGGQYR